MCFLKCFPLNQTEATHFPTASRPKQSSGRHWVSVAAVVDTHSACSHLHVFNSPVLTSCHSIANSNSQMWGVLCVSLFWQIHINYERAQCQLLTCTLPVNIFLCFFTSWHSLCLLKVKSDCSSSGWQTLCKSTYFVWLSCVSSFASMQEFSVPACFPFLLI